MKTNFKSHLAALFLITVASMAYAQDKKYHIVIETEKDGKSVSIDTTFSDRESMEAFLNDNDYGISHGKMHSIPAIPDMAGLPDMDKMMIELDGGDLTPEQKAEIEKALAEARKEMEHAQVKLRRSKKEMKAAQEKMEHADKEMKTFRIKVESDNDTGEKVIIKHLSKDDVDSEEPGYFFFNTNGDSDQDEDVEVKVISSPSESDSVQHKIIIIKKSKSGNTESEELNWNESVDPVENSDSQLAFVLNEEPLTETATIPAQNNEAPSNTSKVSEDYNLTLDNFKIYPNPADNKVNVSFIIDAPGQVEIRMLDGAGRVVVEDTFTTEGGLVDREYNVEGRAKGTYLLQIRQGEKWKHEKVILK